MKWHIKFKIITIRHWKLAYHHSLPNAQHLCQYAPTRALCASTSKLLQFPRTNIRLGSRSFCESAPTLWNSLPHSVRFCESLTTFQEHLKQFFFNWHTLMPPAIHYPSTSDSIFDLWHFINLFIYLLTYLLHTAMSTVLLYFVSGH